MDSLEDLTAALDRAAAGLMGVTKQRMLGCDGLFANGNVFGLVWKEGRIGVRLPNEIAYAQAMKMPGSSAWQTDATTMSYWVFVPVSLHGDANRLCAWVRRAHALTFTAPKRAPEAVAKPVKDAKPAKKRATAAKKKPQKSKT